MLPPPSEDTRVADLTRRVENLESALRAAFTTISGGRGLRVDGGGDITLADGGRFRVLFPESLGGGLGVYFGDIYSAVDGTYQGTGLLVQDADGGDIAVFRSDQTTGRPLVQIRDSSGNTVFYTDISSGKGLGRPYLPLIFYPSRNTDWISTTSGAFETLYRAKGPSQHSKILARVWTQNDTAGATGEVRVMVNGAQLGATQTTSTGITERQFYALDGVDSYDDMSVEIQGRVVSGGGALRICPSSGDGRP